LISSNFYWLSTEPEASADFSDLENLPDVTFLSHAEITARYSGDTANDVAVFPAEPVAYTARYFWVAYGDMPLYNRALSSIQQRDCA
jgi:hypothetical protein